MRKIVVLFILGAVFCALFGSKSYAQESAPYERVAEEAMVRTIPNGVEVTASDQLYKPKPKSGSGDNTCDDEGNKWRIWTDDDTDRSFPIASFGSDGTGFDIGQAVPANPTAETLSMLAYSKTGRWWACGSGYNDILYPENGLIDIEALVATAIDSVSPGVPQFSVQPGFDKVYAQTPLLFHIDDEYWKSYTASASAGRVTVTATMTPIESSWQPGEPGASTVYCGQGEKYQRGRSSDTYPCAYTYGRATEGSPHTLATTVTFKVEATSNVGPLGDFASIPISTTQDIAVKELQAVVVANE